MALAINKPQLVWSRHASAKRRTARILMDQLPHLMDDRPPLLMRAAAYLLVPIALILVLPLLLLLVLALYLVAIFHGGRVLIFYMTGQKEPPAFEMQKPHFL